MQIWDLPTPPGGQVYQQIKKLFDKFIEKWYIRGCKVFTWELLLCTSVAVNRKKRPLNVDLYVFIPLTCISTIGHCQTEDTSLGTVALNEVGSSVFTYFTSTVCDMNTFLHLLYYIYSNYCGYTIFIVYVVVDISIVSIGCIYRYCISNTVYIKHCITYT